MEYFDNIIGQEHIKNHMQAAVRHENPSHAYLLSGEKGSGKKMLAEAFASALQCEGEPGEKPCGKCLSCMQMMTGNHPDVIYVRHEKPNVISVDEIRRQLNQDVGIKPYRSKWKIYIVDEAEKMNVQAQNAALKTLEEPPDYAVILLLTANTDSMLETIKSRCVTLAVRPVQEDTLRHYLMRQAKLPDYQAGLCAAFARGNVGRALLLSSSPEFEEDREETVSLLRSMKLKSVNDLAAVARKKVEKGADPAVFLELLQLWYRDVLLYKATNSAKHLIFNGEVQYIKKTAAECSFEGLNRILEAITQTADRLSGNVNAELSMEWLLLTCRDELIGANPTGQA
ncbi:MAG: DNA polymerase III subunit delta' [Lachnospiraceae bacterium]|nr:DNA polymerase III subunit delta' [Lachnospiraceae bacterium]